MGAIAGITAAAMLVGLCVTCLLAAAVGRWCLRTGRCPKRLRLLLANYTFEAKLIPKTKPRGARTANEMEEANGGAYDERHVCPTIVENSSDQTNLIAKPTKSKARSASAFWTSSTPTRTSNVDDADPPSPRTIRTSHRRASSSPLVGACAEDEHDDDDSAAEQHTNKRSFLTARGLFGMDSSRRSSSGARLPRVKRCRQQSRSHAPGPSEYANDTASEPGGSEAGSVASTSYRRRASWACQMGWLMRNESEAAFLETRAPGSGTPLPRDDSSEHSAAIGGAPAASESAGESADPSRSSSRMANLMDEAAAACPQISRAPSTEPAFTPEMVGTPRSDPDGLLSPRSEACSQDTQSERNFEQDITAFEAENPQIVAACSASASTAAPPVAPLTRGDSATSPDTRSAMELRDASVKDIKQFIRNKEGMLRI